jgi:hypothetical protein
LLPSSALGSCDVTPVTVTVTQCIHSPSPHPPPVMDSRSENRPKHTYSQRRRRNALHGKIADNKTSSPLKPFEDPETQITFAEMTHRMLKRARLVLRHASVVNEQPSLSNRDRQGSKKPLPTKPHQHSKHAHMPYYTDNSSNPSFPLKSIPTHRNSAHAISSSTISRALKENTIHQSSTRPSEKHFRNSTSPELIKSRSKDSKPFHSSHPFTGGPLSNEFSKALSHPETSEHSKDVPYISSLKNPQNSTFNLPNRGNQLSDTFSSRPSFVFATTHGFIQPLDHSTPSNRLFQSRKPSEYVIPVSSPSPYRMRDVRSKIAMRGSKNSLSESTSMHI